MKPKDKLTAREEKFCYEYVLHLNATKAAINKVMDNITIKRDSEIIGKIPADERTVFLSKPDGHVSATFYHSEFINIQIWDCLNYSNVNYYLNSYPEILKCDGAYIYHCDLLTSPTNKRGMFTH